MAQPISNIASGISIDKSGGIGKTNKSSVVNGIMSIFPKTQNLKAPAGPNLNQNVVSPELRASGVPSIVAAPSAMQPSSISAPIGASTPSPYQSQGGVFQQPAPTQGILPPPSPETAYGSLVGDLAFSGLPTKRQTGLVKDIRDTAGSNQGLINQARNIGDQYAGKIAEVGRLGAGAVAGDLSTGTNVVGAGNAAIASQSASARQQALAADAQQQLGALDRQITGTGQMGSQLGTALSGANALQSQQIGAIGTAAGLAQPSPSAVGQTVFDPLTGQYDNSSTGGLSPEVMQQYAQMAATGQYAAIPSIITSNPVLNAQLNVGAKAIDPNYTPVGAQGASQVLVGLPELQASETQSEGIKNSIQSYLKSNPQLNASDLVAGNKVQQWLNSGQFGDPKYQTLAAYLNEYISTLTPIMGVGGNVTDLKTQMAAGMINAAASGASISEVLNNIQEMAKHKVIDRKSGALGGDTSVPNTAGSTGAGGFAEAW